MKTDLMYARPLCVVRTHVTPCLHHWTLTNSFLMQIRKSKCRIVFDGDSLLKPNLLT